MIFSHAHGDRPGIRLSSFAPWLICFAAVCYATTASAQFTSEDSQQKAADLTTAGTGTDSGTVRLRQSSSNTNASTNRNDDGSEDTRSSLRQRNAMPRYVPSEFERYVQSQVQAQGEPQALRQNQGQSQYQNQDANPSPRIRRFGANLVTDVTESTGSDNPLLTVPENYVIKPGDEIALTLWGTVDADLRLTVDRAGRISVPRVGTIQVAGVKYADLNDAVSRRVAKVFKNFQLSTSLGQLRAVRVFVAGYAQRPGSLTVSSLSSVLHVLMRAGGPSAAGSFRNIVLRRGGKAVAHFDLYDLLLKGDRQADQVIQADDVIFIGPVGTQVGIIGSVNEPAVFEMLPGETLNDALQMAGGFNAVADRTRVAVERLSDRTAGKVSELALPAQSNAALGTGDVIRAFSAITAKLPQDKQRKRVRVEGEVIHPGDYVLPAGSTINDALQAAGGLTPAAYVFGTEFSRESVRKTQQDNYDRALRDLETNLAKNQSSQRVSTADEVSAQTASAATSNRLIERLRAVRPTGRIVLEVKPSDTALPNLALEDGDQLNIPSASTSVGVFGSVFSGGSFLYTNNKSANDYLQLAGGATKGADPEGIFVLRANGSVVSSRQNDSFWSRSNGLGDTPALPGDTLFVPEEFNKSTFTQNAKDWTQILYQFGLGVAGIKAVGL
jgi:protein involved in polysaccharide export with SLBB domain